MAKVFTLKNKLGTVATFTDYGATVISLKLKGRRGRMDDVLLGYKNLAGFLSATGGPYFGSTIGRYGNRIGGATFKLNGKRYKLSANQYGNCLHGGLRGWDKLPWDAKKISGKNFKGLKFSLVSPDGDQGFPGKVWAEAIYCLSDDNALSFEFKARSDRPTHVTMTNHSYFNLKGEGKGDILGHTMWINSDAFLEFNPTQIPTGKVNPIKNGLLDFRVPKAIAGDVDHHYVLNKGGKKNSLSLAAIAHDSQSGRSLELWTEAPGLQFYAGGNLKGTIRGKSGVLYKSISASASNPSIFLTARTTKNFPRRC